MLLAESEGGLQRVVNEFYSVCKRRKLKVNAGRNKVMVFERREEEVVDFNTAYRVLFVWTIAPLEGSTGHKVGLSKGAPRPISDGVQGSPKVVRQVTEGTLGLARLGTLA